MSAGCSQGEHEGMPCVRCGYCDHDVVLNGACFYCGSTEVLLDNKKEAPLVPLSSLTRKRDEPGDE